MNYLLTNMKYVHKLQDRENDLNKVNIIGLREYTGSTYIYIYIYIYI